MSVKKLILRFTFLFFALALSACSSYFQDIDEGGSDFLDNNNSAQYSWDDATASYQDPYSDPYEEGKEIQTTEYKVAGNSIALPANVQYFNSKIGNVVHFAVDSMVLNYKSKQILQKEAQWLAQHHHKILIEGYTDDRGTKLYNIALGKKRANAVRSYLINLGVPSTSIKTVSYGVEHPVASCRSEKCWAKNRRARIVVK